MRTDAFSMDAGVAAKANGDTGQGLYALTLPLESTGVDCTLAQMRLSDLRIDPQQPRQYLPADLRAQAVQGSLSPIEVLMALQERARNGDLEAIQYASDIESLAESLQLDGLIYPLKVETIRLPEGRAGGRILDGERRYWASVWRSMKPETSGFLHTTIDVLVLHVLVLHGEKERDATERLQWAANTQRRDMPVMILAEAAARIQNELASMLKVNRIDLLARYGMANVNKGRDRMLLVKLTAIELHRRTGKSISERMLYRLLMFVNRLTTEARRLAIAANLDYRALETVASAEPAEQAGVIHRIVNGLPSALPKPSLGDLDPAITHALRLFETLKQLTEQEGRVWQVLSVSDSDTLREYLIAAKNTLNVLTQHVNSIDRLIQRF